MDELDDLLKPPAKPGSPHDIRVLRLTSGVLSRRRWMRRGQIAVGLAACFFAGVWAARMMPSRAPSEPPQLAKSEGPPLAPKIQIDPFRNDPPDRIERWAGLASGEKRLELYRRAGDSYLTQGNEPAALRCYRRVLDGGGTDALAFNEHDSWLLMSLKLARQKEN